jgi:hypothetical protein
MIISSVNDRTVAQVRPSNKPILISMNNPHGQDHILWPDPPNSIGWRLWKMLQFYTGATEQDYLRTFIRYRMSDNRKWSVEEATLSRDRVMTAVKGKRRVVVIGVDTLKALGVYDYPRYYRWFDYGFEGMLIPTPSGRSQVYRDEVYTLMTSSLMAELYNEYKHGVL